MDNFELLDFRLFKEISNYYEKQKKLVEEKGLDFQLDEFFHEIMAKLNEKNMLSSKGQMYKRNFFKAFLEVEE
jgi:hypothetical protein